MPHDYEPKTTGIRRLKHSVAASNRRRNMMDAAGKPHTEYVHLVVPTALSIIDEFTSVDIKRDWMEVHGDRLYNHLMMLPISMQTPDMLDDLRRWNNREKLYPKKQKSTAR